MKTKFDELLVEVARKKIFTDVAYNMLLLFIAFVFVNLFFYTILNTKLNSLNEKLNKINLIADKNYDRMTEKQIDCIIYVLNEKYDLLIKYLTGG